MANSYTKQVLGDGPRNFNVKITGILDTSDEALTVVIAPSDCAYFVPRNFRLDGIEYAISDGIEVQLWWEGVPTDALLIAMTGRYDFEYGDTGGITNNAGNPTGKIKLMTTGYITGTQVYTIILSLVKMGTLTYAY